MRDRGRESKIKEDMVGQKGGREGGREERREEGRGDVICYS